MSTTSRNLYAGIVGLAAGTAAAGSTYFIRRRWARQNQERVYDHLEVDVVDALCADDVAGSCPIDVAALGPGLIELTGTVPDEAAATRAAEVAQRVDGVHTVVNRLTVEVLEQHLAENRRRRETGAAELNARGWEGVGSGMGARRQGEETDPNRDDDSQAMTEDAIGSDGRIR
jgi:hypothetical protein